jgi:hypothetical protein
MSAAAGKQQQKRRRPHRLFMNTFYLFVVRIIKRIFSPTLLAGFTVVLLVHLVALGAQ